MGIEPISLSRHDFKSCAYTSSATRALICQVLTKHLPCLGPRAEIRPPTQILAVTRIWSRRQLATVTGATVNRSVGSIPQEKMSFFFET